MIKLLRNYLKPYIPALAGALALLMLQAVCELTLPNMMSELVNTGIMGSGLAEGADLAQARFQFIVQEGMKMLLVTLCDVAAAIGVVLLAARISAGVSRTMRHDVFAKVESFSNAEFDRFSTASLITRTTNDIQQIQMLLVMGIRMMCYAPIMGIGGVVMALNKSVSMSWIIAVAILVILGIIMIAYALAVPKFKVLQSLVDRLNLVSRENLTGMMVIRAFGNETYEEKRFEKANRELRDTNFFTQSVMSVLMPAMMLTMNLLSLSIVWLGGKAIAASQMQVGDMMAFIQYAMQIIMAFLLIAMMFIMVPRAAVAAQRIREVLETESGVKDPEKPQTLGTTPQGEIAFHHVSFRYAGAEDDVLHDITFTAYPGQTTAFIGSTGSGKSTLLNLIPRFYDVTEGEVTYDGIDVRDLRQQELRANIGYIPQKGLLFSGTIESNIRYGREEASAEEIRQAIEVAQAAEFVDANPQKEQLDISQGGGNVSGGQKQRLSIARALVRKPAVYLFDDSFSALDFKTDAALRSALKEYTGDAAVLIVAQRVSTIMHAEQIVVLDEGRVVGIGTHEELLRSCREYREIAQSQLSQRELGA
ncbi:MAG: ABC transporter ATP-binding protein [Eubacteriales bacterium]|nr:ABC transporter ATP-binding protein [Eubacteriales bacterium]